MSRRIGVIADTHNLVRPEAIAALRGVDRILHAGDICRAGALTALAEIAPVLAVRGNNDREPFAESLPHHLDLGIEGVRIHMVHDRADLAEPVSADLIVFGHSHRPSVETRDQTVWLNPGSAGPRRFRLPVTLAVVDLADGLIQPRVITLI